MVYHVNDSNYIEHIFKYDRIVWFFFRKGQEKSTLNIKPFIDGVISHNLELSQNFNNVTYFQTYIEDNPKIMEYFHLMDNYIWSHQNKVFNPRIITVVNGKKHFDQAGVKCYCVETLIEMIFDIYPELVPEPTSE